MNVGCLICVAVNIMSTNSSSSLGAGEGIPIKDQPKLLDIGKAEVLQNFTGKGGKKVALFSLGNMQGIARKAAAQLAADGHDCAIINARFFKPLDADALAYFAQAADAILTLEDHALQGGFGSAVLELLNGRRITTPLARIGWPDVFIEHATTVDYLRERHGLTAKNAVELVQELLHVPSAALRLSAAI